MTMPKDDDTAMLAKEIVRLNGEVSDLKDRLDALEEALEEAVEEETEGEAVEAEEK